MEDEGGRIRACPYCGSTNIEPRMLFGGPMAQLDHRDGSFKCLNCGKISVPLDFKTDSELENFKVSPDTIKEEGSDRDFVGVPIVPLNTAPLFTMGPMDLPIGKIARVVNVVWLEGGFEPKDFSVPFLDYWNAISGARYNAEEIFLMDLSGIGDGRPNFSALKKLLRHRYETWLDMGIQEVQDLFDSFALDISWAVAGTLSCRTMGIYRDIYDLSDHCIPCAYVDREVRWGRNGAGPKDLSKFIRELSNIGYERVAVIDLSRLGTREGYSEDLAFRLEGAEIEILLGGGVKESDFDSMIDIGLKGALVDPFTPVIDDIIRVDKKAEPAETRLPSVERVGRGRPDAVPND